MLGTGERWFKKNGLYPFKAKPKSLKGRPSSNSGASVLTTEAPVSLMITKHPELEGVFSNDDDPRHDNPDHSDPGRTAANDGHRLFDDGHGRKRNLSTSWQPITRFPSR